MKCKRTVYRVIPPEYPACEQMPHKNTERKTVEIVQDSMPREEGGFPPGMLLSVSEFWGMRRHDCFSDGTVLKDKTKWYVVANGKVRTVPKEYALKQLAVQY